MTGTWPQPHEGIRGTDMTGCWLLSLDERAVAHREALIAMAGHLRTATLVGNPAPVARRMSERISRPQPGDLAVATEVLHGRRDPDSRLKGFGILLARRREWAETDAEWEACKAGVREETASMLPDEDRLTDTVYYLQYGPAAEDICRWANSEPAGLPVRAGPFSADAAAERDGTSAVFTRDSLAGALADSGFTLRGQPGPVPDGPRLVTIRVPGGQVTEIRDDPSGGNDD